MLWGLLSALWLACPAFGAEAGPPPFVSTSYSDFSGGLVDAVDATALERNQSPALQNVVIDDPVGSLGPRNGISLCGVLPSGNAALSLYEYARSDGTRRLIVADSANVYGTADCTTWTTIKSGLSARAPPSFRTVRDKLWAVNGSTFPFTWDATTVQTLDTRSGTPSPGPPKCYFLEYWKERVWCARTNDAPSTVFFSDVTDTSGNDLDPSTGTASWPATSAFKVDENGGCAITGLKAFKNRLYVFKDTCGIWEIAFNNNFDNAVYKTYASVGARYNTAITEQDGLLQFAGKDGFYAFDGEQAVRTSQTIPNRFATLVQPLTSTQSKIWTSQSEFSVGTLSSTTVSAIPGSVTLGSGGTFLANPGFESGALSPHACTTSSTDGPSNGVGCEVGSGAPFLIEGSYFGDTSTGGDTYKCVSGSQGTSYFVFNVAGTTLTSNTGYFPTSYPTISTHTIDTSSYGGSIVRVHFRSTCTAVSDGSTYLASLYTGTFTARGNFSWRDYTLDGGEPLTWYIDGFGGIFSSGTWTSESVSVVGVSTFSILDANFATYGGAISFEIRGGTDSGGLASSAYSAITPGQNITLSTSAALIQVRVALTSDLTGWTAPRLDDVVVQWLTGGTNAQSIYSASWKNRVLFSASSGTVNNIQFVRSRLPATGWSVYDLQIGPMTKFNDNFYVAASSWGAIFRGDYGQNDYGRPINWYWESRDDFFEYPFQKKGLLEVLSEFRKGSATSVSVGYAQDEATSFTNKTVDMSGAGRGTKRNFVNGGVAGSYRFRVGGGTLDERVTILGLTGMAKLYRLRE